MKVRAVDRDNTAMPSLVVSCRPLLASYLHLRAIFKLDEVSSYLVSLLEECSLVLQCTVTWHYKLILQPIFLP